MKEIVKEKINITTGPNCPITNDGAVFALEIEGGKISKCTPQLGFYHKGFEKTAQNKLFAQYIPLTDKVDFFAGLFYQQAYISAVEELLELDIPESAQYIRVLTMEFNRISSHLQWLSGFSEIFGIKSAVDMALRLRRETLNITRQIFCGSIPCNYYIFGGVRDNISNDILNNIYNYINNFNKKFKIFNTLLTDSPLFIDRTRNKGIITSEIALPYSITGVNLRASGLAFDFRKEKPYLIYNKLEFSVPTAFNGDCHSRFKLRTDETEVSLNIIKQCTDWLLAHNNEKINLCLNQTEIKPKAGRAVTWTEGPRGLIMCHLVTDGKEKPKRLKWRTPSFYAVQLLEKIAKGCTLDDFVSLYGSLDIALSEIDR